MRLRPAICALITRKPCSRMKQEIVKSWNVFPRAAGASLRILPALPCFWLRRLLITLTAKYWWLMADGWEGESPDNLRLRFERKHFIGFVGTDWWGRCDFVDSSCRCRN